MSLELLTVCHIGLLTVCYSEHLLYIALIIYYMPHRVINCMSPGLFTVCLGYVFMHLYVIYFYVFIYCVIFTFITRLFTVCSTYEMSAPLPLTMFSSNMIGIEVAKISMWEWANNSNGLL
jgi:hypothetical protein